MEAAPSLTIRLRTPIHDDRPVFLVGNFNHWDAKSRQFPMERLGQGLYEYHFGESHLPNFPLEYKYVKGDWGNEEVDAYGCQVNNRKLTHYQSFVEDHVPRWKEHGRSYQDALLPIPHILSEEFEIPQLIKTRRIAALLPHDYHRTDKRYPVLYLQDGQNLFDDHAPFGSWGVNKRLAVMAEQQTADIIIVAIDHAEKDRIAEFTPSYKTTIGVGEGKKYVRFLADTLKPYVDKHFRTLPDQADTGIGGSSMGGLISIYAGLMYPEVYGKLMIFSPSLWVAPNIHFQTIRFQSPYPSRIYLYAGGKESSNMVPNVQRLKRAIEENGASDSRIAFKLSIDPEGVHNEEHWGREFPKAVEWLFFEKE